MALLVTACRSAQPTSQPEAAESSTDGADATSSVTHGEPEHGARKKGGDAPSAGSRAPSSTTSVPSSVDPSANGEDKSKLRLSAFWPIEPDGWSVLALSYGESTYPLRLLVRGADEDERHPMGWFIWLIRQGDTLILVDTGFLSDDKAESWGIERFRTADTVLAQLDIAPSQIDHLVLTHAHWDHIGGLSLFDNATVWLREKEYEWLTRKVGDDGTRSAAGTRRSDLKVVDEVRKQGRLRLLDEDTVSLLPGLMLYGGGMHTPGAQWLSVQAGDETIVLASDNAYLFRNIEGPVAVGTAASARKNFLAIEQMRAVASDTTLIVPGHDPAVLERYPSWSGDIDGVVQVAPRSE